jgi:hypothetical protein
MGLTTGAFGSRLPDRRKSMKKKAALALLAMVASAGLSACGGNSDSQVAQDLKGLLDQYAVSYGAVSCASQSGNQYVCKVDNMVDPFHGNLGNRLLDVTDDGHNVSETDAGPVQ